MATSDTPMLSSVSRGPSPVSTSDTPMLMGVQGGGEDSRQSRDRNNSTGSTGSGDMLLPLLQAARGSNSNIADQQSSRSADQSGLAVYPQCVDNGEASSPAGRLFTHCKHFSVVN